MAKKNVKVEKPKKQSKEEKDEIDMTPTEKIVFYKKKIKENTELLNNETRPESVKAYQSVIQHYENLIARLSEK